MGQYCLDTSVLLEGGKDKGTYPLDTFGTLWRHIDELIEAGNAIAPDEVLCELEKRDDEVHTWAKARPNLFYPLDEELQQAVIDILEQFPRLVEPRKSRHQADPFVIALAKVTGRVVVTGERNNGTVEVPKIPNVCAHYGIECITLMDMIREQSWRF